MFAFVVWLLESPGLVALVVELDESTGEVTLVVYNLIVADVVEKAEVPAPFVAAT